MNRLGILSNLLDHPAHNLQYLEIDVSLSADSQNFGLLGYHLSPTGAPSGDLLCPYIQQCIYLTLLPGFPVILTF
jgi:hypothetical protein